MPATGMRITATPEVEATRWRALRLLPLLAILQFAVACRQEPPLPTLFAAPVFSLVDQRNVPFGTAGLAGRISLANFVYTTCTDTCPLLSATMGRLQEQLKADGLLGGSTVLLSFSIDPETDTPAVLAAYAERFGAEAENWKFLTGAKEDVYRVAEGFKLGRPFILPPDSTNPRLNLAHSNRFVLADGAGQVRATYLGQSVVVADVMRDIKRLVREKV